MSQFQHPDSSVHLQISSFSSDVDYKTYKIIYKALKGKKKSHHQEYYNCWHSR